MRPRRLGERRAGCRCCGTTGMARFEDVTVAARAGRADRLAVGRLGRLRQRRLGRPVRLRRVRHVLVRRAVRRRQLADPRRSAQPRPALSQRGDGTFIDVAEKAGVAQRALGQGRGLGRLRQRRPSSTCTSRTSARTSRLYRNNGDGTFTDVARELGVAGPPRGFTCGFWDYDNDGRLDLFVTDYGATLERVAWPDDSACRRRVRRIRRLYHNLGADGLPRREPRPGWTGPCWRWGSNVGDIDNDGFLDIYLGDGPARLLGPDAGPHVQERRRAAVRGHHRLVRGPATSRRGTASRSPTTTATATSTCSSRLGGGDPGDRGLQRSCSRTPATAGTG